MARRRIVTITFVFSAVFNWLSARVMYVQRRTVGLTYLAGSLGIGDAGLSLA